MIHRCLVTLMMAWCLTSSFFFEPPVAWAGQTSIIKIYLDADFSVHKAAGMAIEQGIRTALDEVDNQVGGQVVELVLKDHRGSTPRSLHHLKQFLDDPKALLVFSGLHSPPLLANREFINKQRILVLDPWAAAGPITRYPSKENWIFRLSIDDSKAGFVIVNHVIQIDKFRRPFLLLEDTGWGKSNDRTMRKAISSYKKQGVSLAGQEWFNWGLGSAQAKRILKIIHQSDADVILFVGGGPDGKTFTKTLLKFPDKVRLPIRSHWGITGGNFPDEINVDMRKKIDLAFIQTKFSFVNQPNHPLGRQVLQRAQKMFPQHIQGAADIEAPTGFIHAYDLTKLMIAAAQQAGLSGDPQKDRANLRMALETLRQPVKGLIKTYSHPFGEFSEKTPDAHEALTIDDFVMGQYGDQGEIRLLLN